MNVEKRESFVGLQNGASFSDLIAVFVKNAVHAGKYPLRMKDKIGHLNGRVNGSDEFSNPETCPEDGWKKTWLGRLFA